ncbi:PREDICTED: putative pentatricopeptide repeat-containing protein At5g59200, chloroplastic [Nelumbo nucifera]|uniref:Pentatricopeptide repeat-containing protein n=2 Tax=Nelumbo nucifera TaxID=4432 RepID=A0A822ZXB8_NELNU|nr:PREDICTED: putative pentatricopeptide repeat-containing protein At5g59200, chloroplastic [Nelumbo nucifera]DAD47496.1 TPA_asm: hypothetical protein HUJ06_017433 [Nelumbo nucifera]
MVRCQTNSLFSLSRGEQDIFTRCEGSAPHIYLQGRRILAETVSKHIIDKAGCLSDGEYMILSNMFALHGRWKEADNWRRMMKEAGISKVAGCSTIEINGRMYRFLAGDREGG